MVIDNLKQYDEFVIYGGQKIAVGAMVAIEALTGRRPVCFAVGKSKGKPCYAVGNPEEIYGIPVRPIEEISKDMFLIVAVPEMVQKEVLPFLEENGYHHVFSLASHEEHLLMSEYYRKAGIFPLAEMENDAGDGSKDFYLYEVKNDRDKPLDYHPELFPYEHPIQAGAELTDKSIAEIKDNTGVHISAKNRMYCEMSAVYWIWKNTDHDWIGIEHYRRHLLVKPEMLSDEVDAILTVPYICYPHTVTQLLRYVSEDVLDALLKALKELHPDKYEDYYNILYGKYQYNYNMVCARKEVFDNYCSWFFEITEYMEKTYGAEVPELIETRAFSYVAEVLTNIYFMYHQRDLRIRHVEKEIYA